MLNGSHRFSIKEDNTEASISKISITLSEEQVVNDMNSMLLAAEEFGHSENESAYFTLQSRKSAVVTQLPKVKARQLKNEKKYNFHNHQTEMSGMEWDIRSFHSTDLRNEFCLMDDNNDCKVDWEIKSINEIDEDDINIQSFRKVEEYLKRQSSHINKIEGQGNSYRNIESREMLKTFHGQIMENIGIEDGNSEIMRSHSIMSDETNQIGSIQISAVQSNVRNYYANGVSIIDIDDESDDNYIAPLELTSVFREEVLQENRSKPSQSSTAEIEIKKDVTHDMNVDDVVKKHWQGDEIKFVYPESIMNEEKLIKSERHSSHSDIVEMQSEIIITKDEVDTQRADTPIKTPRKKLLISEEIVSANECADVHNLSQHSSSITILINSKETSDVQETFDKVDLKDHFTYNYEDPIKTEKLKDLTKNMKQDTMTKTDIRQSVKLRDFQDAVVKQSDPILLTTDCLKQTFHVDHRNEDLVNEPIIHDAQGQLITNLQETDSFRSITENVTLQIHESKAQVKIEISVEMYHNMANSSWKRKNVVLTRTIELDLLKLHHKDKIEGILKKYYFSPVPVTLGEKDDLIISQYHRDNRLTSRDTFLLFSNFLDIIHKEERLHKSHIFAKDDFYLTDGPECQAYGVVCEPQYLISNYREMENYLYY